MILKLSELRVVAFAEFAEESKKSIVTLWYWVPKRRSKGGGAGRNFQGGGTSLIKN